MAQESVNWYRSVSTDEYSATMADTIDETFKPFV